MKEKNQQNFVTAGRKAERPAIKLVDYNGNVLVPCRC